MNRCVAIAALLSASAVVSDAAAQQRPDFNGQWTRVADSVAAGRPSVAASGDAAFRRGDMGSGWGSPITITQDAGRLTVEYVFFGAYDLQPPLRFTYALDGSETRNVVMVGHASSEQRSRVAWAGNTLVITTLVPGPAGADGRNATAEVRQTLTLESAGTLRVETTRVGVLGGATTTTSATYTKR